MDSKFRSTEFVESGNFSYPIIPIIGNTETRICRNNNYVPHRRPRFTSIERWVDIYHKYIIDIFIIIKYNICNSPLYKFIDWDSQVIFNNLRRLLYHCSSKYILPDDLIEYNEDNSDYDSDS